MRKNTAAEMGKSGQIWDTKLNTGQMGIPGADFLGHVVENMDCPGKSRTDGHLRFMSLAWFCYYAKIYC